MTLQGNWECCNKCQGLFYLGGGVSPCPAGGIHTCAQFTGWAIDPTGSAVTWKRCGQCQGLFQAGVSSGVCPTHAVAADSEYFLLVNTPAELNFPVAPASPAWMWCGQCQNLFLASASASVCAAGGAHVATEDYSYVLQTSAVAGQTSEPGWSQCNKCQSLFYAAGGGGVCPAGSSHEATGPNFFISQSANAGQAGWKWCYQCQCLFYGANTLGVCPHPGSHTAADNIDYVLPVPVPPGSGWGLNCNRCQGLFFVGAETAQPPSLRFGVCPSRAGSTKNQPTLHDGTGSPKFGVWWIGSSFNYYLSNNCTSLEGVSVTIVVTEDLVLSTNSQSPGYSFQLNCNSLGQSANAWQQFIIWIQNNVLQASDQSWDQAGNNVFAGPGPVTFGPNLPNNILPTNFELTISIEYSSATPPLPNGANFTVKDNHGKTWPSASIPYSSLEQTVTGGIPASSDSAPIAAFQLDLVGVNTLNAQFASGACTVTYQASSALTPSLQKPGCAEGSGTAETSNVAYSVMAGGGNGLTQNFIVPNPVAPSPPGPPQIPSPPLPPAPKYCVEPVQQLQQILASGQSLSEVSRAKWSVALLDCMNNGTISASTYAQALSVLVLIPSAGPDLPMQ
jgi:hypothetical protein